MNKLEIIDEFYDTATMSYQKWKRAMLADRSVFTQFACHSFHYVFCKDKNFHPEAKTTCKCFYCNEICTQYHILNCKTKIISLREAAKMKFKIIN